MMLEGNKVSWVEDVSSVTHNPNCKLELMYTSREGRKWGKWFSQSLFTKTKHVKRKVVVLFS